MKTVIALGFGILFARPDVASASGGRYNVTDAERAACEGDVIRLCSSAYPDEDAVVACMKLNIAALTPSCRPVFIEGLRRRGLR